MKRLALLLVLLMPLLAQAYSCEGKTGDDKRWCQAMRSKSDPACSSIKDDAQRKACRVRLGSTPAACNQITDGFKRDQCKAGRR